MCMQITRYRPMTGPITGWRSWKLGSAHTYLYPLVRLPEHNPWASEFACAERIPRIDQHPDNGIAKSWDASSVEEAEDIIEAIRETLFTESGLYFYNRLPRQYHIPNRIFGKCAVFPPGFICTMLKENILLLLADSAVIQEIYIPQLHINAKGLINNYPLTHMFQRTLIHSPIRKFNCYWERLQ